jgi:hypothetical protein
MAVVEQPPKGGDGVTIRRDSSDTHIHLAILLVCDACTLYVSDWRAIIAQNHVPIYGNRRILYVQYALS